MLISSRRMVWGVIFILAATASLIIRPVRSWLDRAMVQQIVAAGFSVEEVHVYAKDGVVELKQLDWRSNSNSRRFQFFADNAWFAFESEPLLDRRLLFPRATIPKAQIVLDDYRTPRAGDPTIWEQRLTARLAEIDWREVGSHFTSLLASDNAGSDWQSRLQDWILRSEKIAEQATALGRKAVEFDNPLRVEDEIAAHLANLQKLSNEQTILAEQIEGVRKLLDARAVQLQEKLTEATQQIEDLATVQSHELEFVKSISRELMFQVAASQWRKLAQFAEVGDRLTRGACEKSNMPRAANDLNIRSAKNPLMAIDALEAEGVFRCGILETPFYLTGEMQQSEAEAYRTTMTCLLNMNFMPEGEQLALIICNRSSRPLVNDIQLARVSDDESEKLPMLVLASAGETLDGSLTLLREELETEFAIEGLDSVQLQVSGSWQHPSFEIDGDLPPWLVNLARQRIESRIRNAQATAQQELRTAYEAHLAAKQKKLETLILSGQLATQKHREVIASATNKLQEHRDELQAVEFARRPRDFRGSITR